MVLEADDRVESETRQCRAASQAKYEPGEYTRTEYPVKLCSRASARLQLDDKLWRTQQGSKEHTHCQLRNGAGLHGNRPRTGPRLRHPDPCYLRLLRPGTQRHLTADTPPRRAYCCPACNLLHDAVSRLVRYGLRVLAGYGIQSTRLTRRRTNKRPHHATSQLPLSKRF